MSEDLRFPVGKWVRETRIDAARRAELVDQIAKAPGFLSAAVAGLSEVQLDTLYRPDGWTVRQVVHHVPDSHLNAYIRIKLALTEQHPAVKTYEEQEWALLPDVRATPVATSLALLAALHSRWVILLKSLDEASFARTTQHPQWGGMSIDEYVQLYAWHGRHHTAHVTELVRRMNW